MEVLTSEMVVLRAQAGEVLIKAGCVAPSYVDGMLARERVMSTYLDCGLLYLGAIAGIYYLASFDGVHDISWWVNTGVDRLLMPALLMLWMGGISRVEILIAGKNRT